MAENLVFREIKGDLFTAPDDFALAHCVPVSMTMGAGIARLFKSKFGRVQELKDQNAKVGGMAVIKHEKRFIYYLITKKDSFNKPTYEDLNSSLKAMKKHMVANGVSKLAIPQIGCGIDRLDWSKVKQMLHDVFGEEKMEIVVYSI